MTSTRAREYDGRMYEQQPTRTVFVLAAIGAALAALFWGALLALLFLGMKGGAKVEGLQLIMPVILVVLYGMRAFAVYNGDRNAAKRLMFLHGLGILASIFQISQFPASAGAMLTMLYGFKIAVHVFGGVTAYLASRE